MKNKLYYTKKAKYFEQSLPVGNGRMGALVFGNLKKERIAINEDSLWSGYPKDNNKKTLINILILPVKLFLIRITERQRILSIKICTVFGAMHICLLAIF